MQLFAGGKYLAAPLEYLRVMGDLMLLEVGGSLFCFVSGSLKFSRIQLKKYLRKLEMKYVWDRSRMNAYKPFYVLLRLAPEPGYMRQMILVAIKIRLHLLNGSSHMCMPHVFTVYMCIYVVFVGNSNSFRCAGS